MGLSISSDSHRINILFLTQYFPPETGAPQARIFEMARHLTKTGYDVQVLTAMPNYPRGIIHDAYRRKLWWLEQWDGIRVVRTAIFPTKRASWLYRMLNYLSFVVSSVLLGAFLARRPHLICVESPPLFLGLSAFVLSMVWRSKVIFNVSDLWPESPIRMGVVRSPRIIRLAQHLERWCYRHSNALTAQSVGIVRGIQIKHPTARVAMVPNGCDVGAFSPQNRDHDLRTQLGFADKIVVGYAGLMGLAQGVEMILNVAELFVDEPRVRFLLAGDGPERERLRDIARERQLSNTVILDLLAREEMPRLVASMDITIIPLRYFIPGALPSKIYEAMSCEIPIVLAALGDPKELVERAQAGIVVDYHKVAAVAAAVRTLTVDESLRLRLGHNGRRYVLQHHRREAIAERMDQVVQAVLNGTWSPALSTIP